MPRLAAFPKAYMHALCKDGTMSLEEWIGICEPLQIEGYEWYAGFLEMADPGNWPRFRKMVERQHRSIPMMCCSPDFTHPDPEFRLQQINKQKKWIDMTAALGGSYCRVLSGQYRPGISTDQGLDWAATCIESCLPHAENNQITLILENHYKDDFWNYPEFAQKMDLFCALVQRIRHPFFGVNYDPSNAFLAGDDPIELLKRISSRVVTMHASDRYLLQGTLEDLRREEAGVAGYAARLAHGEIGRGLNDYDAIFLELRRVAFNGWISIEDGVEGFSQLERSVAFLRKKMSQYWPENKP